jgi:hypothetical protein
MRLSEARSLSRPAPGPDAAKRPIKQPDSPSDTPPEIPKVGTTDAPGG